MGRSHTSPLSRLSVYIVETYLYQRGRLIRTLTTGMDVLAKTVNEVYPRMDVDARIHEADSRLFATIIVVSKIALHRAQLQGV